MSDAVFMAGPILAATGTDRRAKYFDAAATTSRRCGSCAWPDGLYRHSPLCEAAWGRGNGFPALGLALALSDWPDDHPAKAELIAEFQKHIAALKPHQDAKSGCWHQVIDHPESYDEYSCTSMIGFALQRGIRRAGWQRRNVNQPSTTPGDHQTAHQRHGKLVNVCTGTGKQNSLQDYFDTTGDQRTRRSRRRHGPAVRNRATAGGMNFRKNRSDEPNGINRQSACSRYELHSKSMQKPGPNFCSPPCIAPGRLFQPLRAG